MVQGWGKGGPTSPLFGGQAAASSSRPSCSQRMGRRRDWLPNLPWAEGRQRAVLLRLADGPFGEAKDSPQRGFSAGRGKAAKAGSTQRGREGG